MVGGLGLGPGVPGTTTGTKARVHARMPHLGTGYSVRQQVAPKEGGWRARTHCPQHTHMKDQSLRWAEPDL